MQISTREANYLVDTLQLRSDVQLMNEVFTNPKIVKVLHGADFDIQWLQRDFGVYIVNLFDTGQASRVLEYPKKSLAYLLDLFCGITADKQYQLADWRIRPLPKEMEKYAIQDTHYLLYIYDRIKNELAKKSETENHNLILTVLNKSRELCLQVYDKPKATNATSYIPLYNKLRANPLSGPQLDVFSELYQWRDELARQEDESVNYVLPNRMMYAISERLPVTVEDLLSLCVPVPPLTRAHAHEITSMIHKARSGTLNQEKSLSSYHSISSLLKQRSSTPVTGSNPASQLSAPPLLDIARKEPSVYVKTSHVAAEINPSNKSGVSSPLSKGSLFAETISIKEDTKKNKAVLQSCLDNIAKSFDPLFASKIGETVLDEQNQEEEGEKETPNAKKREMEEESVIPQSLAEIHRLSQRNKRQKNPNKKKKVDPQDVNDSPFNYAKITGSKSNPIDLDDNDEFLRTAGWKEEELQKSPGEAAVDYSKNVAPKPSGENRVATNMKKERKSKKKVGEGFKVSTNSVVGKQKQQKTKYGKPTKTNYFA